MSGLRRTAAENDAARQAVQAEVTRKLAAGELLQCPHCRQAKAPGNALQQHLVFSHGLTTAAARKISGLPPEEGRHRG